MASDIEFVEFVIDQGEPDCELSYKRMFGEFGLYSGGIFFGVICDNQVFVKPTEAGRAFIGDPVEAPPYPGAKPSLLVGEQLEDPAWFSELVRITVRELPEKKKRKG